MNTEETESTEREDLRFTKRYVDQVTIQASEIKKKGNGQIKAGLLLMSLPFLLLPFIYWYVFHHAPDSICIASRGRAYQKIHLDIFFDVVLLLISGLFLLPGGVLLAMGLFTRGLVRIVFISIIAIAAFFSLMIAAGRISFFWPNPVFPRDAVKAYNEESKTADDAFNNELKASNGERSMIR